MMRSLTYFYVTATILIELSQATTTINMDNGCDSSGELTKKIHDSDTYYLQWHGLYTPGDCRFHFTTDPGAESYSLCVQAIYFNITDCNIKLQYLDDLDEIFPDRLYGCHDSNPTKYCTSNVGELYIELFPQYVFPSEPNQGSMKLKVTVTGKPKKTILIGICVAGGIGGLVVISIIIYFIIRVRRVKSESVPFRRQTAAAVSQRSGARTQGYSNPNFPHQQPSTAYSTN